MKISAKLFVKMPKIASDINVSRKSMISKRINRRFLISSFQIGKSCNLNRSSNEIYVCSMKNLTDEQDELKKICRRFSGSTRTLTHLREKMNVKDFVSLLNCFPGLEKSSVESNLGGSDEQDFNYRQILISFEDSVEISSNQTSFSEYSLSSFKDGKFKLVESYLESVSESESFFDCCDSCSSNFRIRDLCKDIRSTTQMSDEDSYELYSEPSKETIILRKNEIKSAKEYLEVEFKQSRFPLNISTKLLVVSTVLVISTLIAFKLASLSKI